MPVVGVSFLVCGAESMYIVCSLVPYMVPVTSASVVCKSMFNSDLHLVNVFTCTCMYNNITVL